VKGVKARASDKTNVKILNKTYLRSSATVFAENREFSNWRPSPGTRHRARLGAFSKRRFAVPLQRVRQVRAFPFSGFAKKGKMNKIKSVGLFFGILIGSISQSFCQTNTLQFTAVAVTDEHAIRLTWASTNNEIYQIECVGALGTNADGSTAFQTLYDNYPSQGTNTFWLDTGNYFDVPAILHPKNMPMRFYRIVAEGADTASDEPSISITSPTNGTFASGELTITVVANTDQPILSGTKFYVDGQEMQMADSTTNYSDGSTNYEADTYSINTCEWGNGTHTLFATARCASGLGDALNAPPVLFGHAVSAFVPVTFSNLVTRISFSEPFFDPSAGQTQQVSAVFAANSDWTLNIVDAFSNVVLTTTGSGSSMLYNWDGTGTGGTNLPAGVYYYLISAQTNGLAPQSLISGGSSSSLSAASLSASSRKELYAVADGSESVVPLALYPKGFDTNNLTIFKATSAEIESLYAVDTDSGISVTANSGGGVATPNATPAPSSQPAPPAPQRPPTNPVRGVAGTFGVAYQDYSFSGLALSTPLNGFPVIPGQQPQHVHLNGSSSTSVSCPFVETVEEDNFITQMKRGAWKSGFLKANSQLLASDLQGSGTPFNQVKLGLLSLHGAYGTSVDYNANQAQQIYFPIDGRPNNSSSWVSMSQMSFGGSGTNGLNWMAILACNDLRHANWNSMQSAGVTPFNSNLHLLLGCDTICDDGGLILWAKFMLGLDNNAVQTIMQAWYNSGAGCVNRPVTFAVVGYDDCESDVLNGTNSVTPSGNIFYDSKVVRQ
jgi:hypothetical protein